MYGEYYLIYKYIIFVCIVTFMLFFFSFFLVYQEPNDSKLSSYECGFNPYGDARIKFDIKYYLVAILFILFDLELIFIYPWVISIKFLSIIGYYSMFIFIFILTIGLLYELFSGSLEWN